jgi:hypothetical protein
MGEERREADPVVRSARLLAKCDDAESTFHVELNKPFAKTLADHAIANDDDGLLRHA